MPLWPLGETLYMQVYNEVSGVIVESNYSRLQLDDKDDVVTN